MEISSGSIEKHGDLNTTQDGSIPDTSQAQEPSAFQSFLRVFTFGTSSIYLLQAIAILAATASGIGLAMVNVVMGQFISLLADASGSDSSGKGFMKAVSTTALKFVYIGVVRLICTYVYSSLFTYNAYRLVRNIQQTYLYAAFDQEIGYYDQGMSGSISMQATSNGRLIQSGISEKLGLFIQAISTFVAAFVIAFITQWKLTLILLCIVPTILIVVGGVAIFDAFVNADLFKVYAQAASYAENILVIIAATTIMSIAPHAVVFGRAATAALELFKLIDRESETSAFDDSGYKPESITGVIDIECVNFSYPTRPDVTVLNDFTLWVPAGKVTAIVGPSGSGKSTVVGMLERWYSPKSGTIKLDGREIKTLNLMWLRTNIRLVQQEPVLFNGSVFENIANGLVATKWEHAPHEEQMKKVQEAAKLAFANDFIINLPDSYHTRIGERGGLLSGGQRQRIAIARSIISNPKILLLDEATSALDPHAEGVVQQALDRVSQQRTTIVIAHKLATIRNADNIVVISNGNISEQGGHDELVARGGIYSKLVKAQDLSPAETKTSQGSSPSDEDDLVTENTIERKHGLDKLRAVYPGQTLLLGNIVGILGVDNVSSKANFIALMFFVLAIGCLAIYFAMGWATNVIAQTLSTTLRRNMLESLLQQDLRFFDRPENTVGALISRLESHPQAILELMGINISFILVSAISVLACSILSLIISWKVGVVGVLVGVPPLLLAGWARIRLETKMDGYMNEAFSQSASIASENILALRTVLSLAIEDRVVKRYTDELDNAIRHCTPFLFHMMIWFSLTQCMEHFVLALGFWWGSKLVSDGEITFYQFMVSFMGVYFSSQSAGIMFSFSSSFTNANEAANYYFWLSELRPTISETENNRDREPENGYSSYHLKDVKFSYSLSPQIRVLQGISLTIKRGEFVAFVGASGCGKSTLVSLLERFYDPVSGVINIDSAPLTSINPKLYRRHVALVQQEPALFPGSIRENVSHGTSSDNALDVEIEAACRAANAWDFISSLPEGLNTPCGTSGNQLSGGQRQRIAIARALIRKPSVILLDEATSALDTDSERIVQSGLVNVVTGDRITIAVAHRLSTVRQANRIFVFSSGRIVEAGTHEELIQKNDRIRYM
ncbi:hypothetical protein G7Z17_g1838 [Cylindrodendrum hubeiense]|uniref:Uncharacterized protein n=1 Tax=Cylindrodendrum hubeiense TaxID=595255 RepID=A0A9P5HM81_9HYPO|nr:hypothetical protein G7Z17_g1838 [Cylindrodendrum hubeiense]